MIVTKHEIRKVCPNGHKLGSGFWIGELNFCPHCGLQMFTEIREIKQIECPKCGSHGWRADWHFCGDCGYQLTLEERKDFQDRSIRRD